MKLIIKTIVLFFLLFKSNINYSQIITNMSFEGIRQKDIPPNGWTPCNQFSTPDTQPGSWEVTTPASNGSSYIGLATRGNLGPYANNAEAVQTKLLVPLTIGKVYNLYIDLSYSREWGHYIDFGSTFLKYDTPAKLRVSGGSKSCEKLEVLWVSPVIDHTEWKNYSMKLEPKTSNIDYLILEAAYADVVFSFGNILIDNISIDLCDIAMPIETQSSNSLICKGDSIVIDASTPGGAYRWSNGSTRPSVTVTLAGAYTVEVSNGCDTETFEYLIQSKECNCEVTVPNVFTPNEDGINDTFEIIGMSDIARYNLRIFNRWGKLVYQADKISNHWAGDLNGSKLPSGVYYWAIDIMCLKGKMITDNSFKGWVSIQR